MDHTVRIGVQGRLVIPVDIRVALGLAEGDHLHLQVSGHRLILERPQDAVTELRRLGTTLPNAKSLVDELLDERRGAAADGG